MPDGQLCLSISLGSVARVLPAQKPPAPDPPATHRWTVYVRGRFNEDLAPALKSVSFTLHSSFEQPVRVITQPPFTFPGGRRFHFREPGGNELAVWSER